MAFTNLVDIALRRGCLRGGEMHTCALIILEKSSEAIALADKTALFLLFVFLFFIFFFGLALILPYNEVEFLIDFRDIVGYGFHSQGLPYVDD